MIRQSEVGMKSGSYQSWDISVDFRVKFFFLVFKFQLEKKSFRSGLITDNVGYQNEKVITTNLFNQIYLLTLNTDRCGRLLSATVDNDLVESEAGCEEDQDENHHHEVDAEHSLLRLNINTVHLQSIFIEVDVAGA